MKLPNLKKVFENVRKRRKELRVKKIIGSTFGVSLRDDITPEKLNELQGKVNQATWTSQYQSSPMMAIDDPSRDEVYPLPDSRVSKPADDTVRATARIKGTEFTIERRRAMMVYMRPEVVLQVLNSFAIGTDDETIGVPIFAELPEGYIVLGIHFDNVRDMFGLLIYHPSFIPVDEGKEIPSFSSSRTNTIFIYRRMTDEEIHKANSANYYRQSNVDHEVSQDFSNIVLDDPQPWEMEP